MQYRSERGHAFASFQKPLRYFYYPIKCIEVCPSVLQTKIAIYSPIIPMTKKEHRKHKSKAPPRWWHSRRGRPFWLKGCKSKAGFPVRRCKWPQKMPSCKGRLEKVKRVFFGKLPKAYLESNDCAPACLAAAS